MDVIDYQQDSTTVSDIVEFLQLCDSDFIPPLSSRVLLTEYGEKIFTNAVRFEAKFKGQLVGLVALYCNDPHRCLAHITSVSVLNVWSGKGIASRLMSDCIDYVKLKKVKQIALQVNSDNLAAFGLYEHKGFTTTQVNGSTLSMTLDLAELIEKK